MKLEVGEFYLSAGGEIVKIAYCDTNYCYDTNEVEYFKNGKYLEKEHHKDLIAHIPKELHWSIVSQVYSYHKNINARNKIIRRYKNFCNKKTLTIPD